MPEIIKLAINGAGGRMGQRLLSLAKDDPTFEVVCAIEADDHPFIGKQFDSVPYVSRLSSAADVVVDFSLPEGTEKMLAQAINGGTALVIGTTGLTGHQQTLVDQAARSIPIVQAANYGVGINVLLKLVAQAARFLGEQYDVEIVEAHHRFKKDAPSGTALALGRSVCEALGKDLDENSRHGRQGPTPRVGGEIGFHAVRLGDTVGDHAVHFGTLGETITLSHSAHSRDTFALGALRAAAWLAGKPAGKYSMEDVLFGESKP